MSFYVPTCVVCDREGDLICQKCYEEFLFAIPFLVSVGASSVLFVPFYVYNLNARKLVTSYKDKYYTMYRKVLEGLIGRHFREDPYKVWSNHLLFCADALFYISTKRYSQDILNPLAYYLARCIKVDKVFALTPLKNQRFHRTKGDLLSRYRTMFNTQWVLAVQENNYLSIKDIVIFDDVATTLSTLSGAYRFLKNRFNIRNAIFVTLFYQKRFLE